MTKEEIHDAQIRPLMDQIIVICAEHTIAALACFHLPTPKEDDFYSVTLLPGDGGAVHEPFAKALAVMDQETRGPVYVKTTNPDGTTTLTSLP